MNKDDIDDPIWVEAEVEAATVNQIVSRYSIHPVTARILAAKGFKDDAKLHNYLYAKLPNLLNPDTLPGMSDAINRIEKARQNKERILIYGDNDVDGITATTLLTDFFSYLEFDVSFAIAQRYTWNGGSLSGCIEKAREKNASLVITVDCGITAIQEINDLTNEKIDVIVTDHHEPSDILPLCSAIINPKLKESRYKNRDITGVGVAFKLAHAFSKYLISNGILNTEHIDLKRYLDLVALGTIADMGALVEENRIFVRYGLLQLQNTKRIGLKKLLKISGFKDDEISPNFIASKVAPRLNSLGRIADPNRGVELLLAQSSKLAEELAKELDLKNLQRQQIEKKDAQDISNLIAAQGSIVDDKAIVLHSYDWHPGIIPILSARLAKMYTKPAVVITCENGVGKGSIRTIPEFPVTLILKKLSHLLLSFGGHDYAAGMTIQEKNIPEFVTLFKKYANDSLTARDTQPKLHIDTQADFTDLTFDFLESLSLLEPFGNENPAPILICEARQVWPPKVIGKTNLKMYLEKNNRFIEGIAFGLAHKKQLLIRKNLRIKVAFTPQINSFHNKSSIQLHIKDFIIIEE